MSAIIHRSRLNRGVYIDSSKTSSVEDEESNSNGPIDFEGYIVCQCCPIKCTATACARLMTEAYEEYLT